MDGSAILGINVLYDNKHMFIRSFETAFDENKRTFSYFTLCGLNKRTYCIIKTYNNRLMIVHV